MSTLTTISFRILRTGVVSSLLCVGVWSIRADSNVYLLDVPDYSWFAGCFGTASGNLMGYWDRHGFPNFYAGPTAGGIAPLDDRGPNIGIRSLWASRAGFDGRPADRPGHIDDYWVRYASDSDFSYQSTASDPYITAGRPEHAPGCVGDFIGLSQQKWTDMNGECDGNIDAYSFVYWDTNGNRRSNYSGRTPAGAPAPDIQSGLREWTKFRGSEADVFTQLADFNPRTPADKGFTFEDVKTEINAGYPVLVFLQDYNQLSRAIPPMAKANPEIHGMLVYGYLESSEFGVTNVVCRTSWASGDRMFYPWLPSPWVSDGRVNLAVRGVIGYRPKPQIRNIRRAGQQVTIDWEGPSSQLHDALAQTTTSVHRYQIEKSSTLNDPWMLVDAPTTAFTTKFTDCCDNTAFYRVRLLGANE